MSIPEEKERYFRETAVVLGRGGFQVERGTDSGLRVRFEGEPLCKVTEDGGIIYRMEDVHGPERRDARDQVYETVRTTAEYMRLMEAAPFLKADGLEGEYRVLADFNGTVLAGVPSRYGVQFVTWDWDFDHTGVCHGHYFSGSYDGAKRDFAVRSGMISGRQFFREEQLVEIYRCCTEALQGGDRLLYDQERIIRGVGEQIEECLPGIRERIAEPMLEQTME